MQQIKKSIYAVFTIKLYDLLYSAAKNKQLSFYWRKKQQQQQQQRYLDSA